MKLRFGFMKRGNCWRWKFQIWSFSTCVYISFWRFYAAWDKKGKE